jgi:hypothetical protein
MRSFVAKCCSVGVALLAGCGGGDEEAKRRAENRPTDCSAHGSLTDLGSEPQYSANYLHRCTTADGCSVRLDVLMTRQGKDACGGERVADILMGWPLGRSHHGHRPYRIYVRDPEQVISDAATSEAFEDDAELPADAVDTGFRQGRSALWMRPNDDSFVYLVIGTEWKPGRAMRAPLAARDRVP